MNYDLVDRPRNQLTHLKEDPKLLRPMISSTAQPGITGSVRLGENLIDFDRNVLAVDGEQSGLRAKAVQVLQLLIERDGAVVTRAEFIDLIWEGNPYTGDRGLTDTIWEIRQTLFGGKSIVETIPKKGYRLTVTPEFLEKPNGRSDGSTKRRLGLILLPLIVIAATAFGLRKLVLSTPHQTPPIAALEARSVTSQPGYEWMADIAPDQNALCFVWLRDHGESEIVTLDLDGESQAPLVVVDSDHKKRVPCWSPDAGQIGYLAAEDNRWWLRIVDVRNRQVRQLRTSLIHELSQLVWSRHGLIYRSQQGDAWEITLLDLNTQSERVLIESDDRFTPSSVRVSPDNRRLLYLKRDLSDGSSQLWMRHFDGNDERRLAPESGNIIAADWQSDDRITFVCMDDAHAYQVNLDRDAIEILGTTSELDLSEMRVFRDGSILAGRTALRARIDQLLLNELERGPLPFLESIGADLSPTYSPRDDQLAFVSTRTDNQSMWLAAGDASNPQILGPPGHLVWKPSWSPVRSELAYIRADDDIYDYNLWTMQVSTKVEHRWTNDDFRYAGIPSWHPDGESILVGRTQNGTGWSLVRVLRDGTIEDLRVNAFFARYALDGSSIYFVPLDRKGLWRRDPDGLETQVINEPLRYTQWLIEGDSIYYIAEDHGTNYLGSYDVVSGQAERLTGLTVRPVLDDIMAYDRRRHRLLFATLSTMERDLVRLLPAPAETRPEG